MNEDPLQEALADEGAFTGETDESELQALVSRLQTNILIIGSGGAGNNTLLRLYKEGMTSLELLAINTDAQHLLNTHVPHRMLIGKVLTKGLGAGADPIVGKDAAEESIDLISEELRNTNMLFLTAGLVLNHG